MYQIRGRSSVMSEATPEEKELEPRIKYLIQKLDDPDYNYLESEMEELWIIGEPAVEPLLKMMQEGKSSVSQVRAYRALLGIGNPAVIPLTGLLAHQNRDVRFWAVFTLLGIGDSRAGEPLLEIINDPDDQIRSTVISALGKVGEIKAVEPLKKIVLENLDINVRAGAVSALAMLGEPGLEKLLELLRNNDEQIRSIVANKLGEIREELAFEPLLELLSNDPDAGVRALAAEALGKIGDRKAVAELERVAQSDNAEIPWGWNVRDYAQEALKQLKKELPDE
jgi:HEAT repeat protein